ncbi:hypothetical protein PJ985_20845 [Streptomyces sp. ACA25]|uniref:hypothetical protein n=1 Tax=Streptomyces sp. ACA25 TaxID=3022596 RepID=UPI002307CB45|nr:hypothetical protein [Streptomyces sp. ACA25]MDB1090011.1 hypothetical protein [Streptomyces sp. ACA25]
MSTEKHLLRTTTAMLVAGAVLAVGASGTAQAQQAAPAHQAATGPAAEAAAFQAALTPEEQEQLRELAGAIWTPQLAAGWNMNPAVADVLSQATDRILQCSEAYSLVPRPPGFLPGVGYLVNYWKSLRDYFLVLKDDRSYRACVVSTAAYYRTPIELASMGI